MCRSSLIATLAVFSLSTRLFAIDFTADIEPILRTHCIECHGPETQESQFRLDRLANMLAGGNSGEPAVMPGRPDDSYLVRLVRHQEPGAEMPPGEALSDHEIQLIQDWILAGAITPPSYGPPTASADLSHWAFQHVSRPRVGGIDASIHAKLANHGLQTAARADRQTLIRRLYLVMLGLPPTPAQVDAFLSDDREDAWTRLVDHVLASSHYGERWATYWLDLVRFGETHGYEMNRERPTAWPYRDWVIHSLNVDLPYDQFLRDQLAGDAWGADVATSFLVAGPVDQVKSPDPTLLASQRMNELDDMINATGTAMLGLTTGCARCHNHKFDPITQRDYYAMQAVFAGVHHGDRELPPTAETIGQLEAMDAEIAALEHQLQPYRDPSIRPPVNSKYNEENFTRRAARFVRLTIEATSGGEGCIDELEIFSSGRNVALANRGAIATSSGDFVHPKHRLSQINDGKHGNDHSWIASSREGGWVQIELPEVMEIDRIVWSRDRNGEYSDRLAIQYRIESATSAGQWELVSSSADRQVDGDDDLDSILLSKLDGNDAIRAQYLLNRLRSLRTQRKTLQQSTVVYAGVFSQPGPTHRLYRGEPDAKRELVGPGTIEALGDLNLDADATQQSRRIALANWIASRENPLTARVIVNRLWQFHFGTGIVDTSSDLGRNGTPPSHPELLDWLASELMDNDWSLKHIHRLILRSETWCQSSRPDPAALRVDATSRLLWRYPPRRLDAEAIRDSVLSVAGVLDIHKAGGPGFSPFYVELENVRHYHAKETFGPQDWRRMIYMTKVRQEREQVFGAFDCPDASMVVSKRSRSTTPTQALNLLNSHFIMQQAELFAERLTKQSATVPERIELAWQLCFQRSPTDDESADCQTLIREEGMVQFTRALLNANEFVFIP